MKKIICALIALLLVTIYLHTAYAAEQTGVLSIPGQGISVALYESSEQAVVDAENSAACFWWHGWVIADHNHQAFQNLKNVQPGDAAVIYQTNGAQTSLRCVDVKQGKNTGHDLIVDGKSMFGQYDYLMYTCINKAISRRGIIITCWEVAE